VVFEIDGDPVIGHREAGFATGVDEIVGEVVRLAHLVRVPHVVMVVTAAAPVTHVIVARAGSTAANARRRKNLLPIRVSSLLVCGLLAMRPVTSVVGTAYVRHGGL
jgi:uncharacterized membrane protein